MTLADELAKLDDMRRGGVLSQDEFEQAKRRLLEQPAPASGSTVPVVAAINRLRRSASDKWIAGVCGGLAQATGLESWAWRLIFALLLLFGGVGIVAYLLLWIFVPAE